jgi:hypothetical protein
MNYNPKDIKPSDMSESERAFYQLGLRRGFIIAFLTAIAGALIHSMI